MPTPLLIQVERNSVPRIKIICMPGGEQFYDFSGANPVQMFTKASPNDPDGAPVIFFPGGGLLPLEPLSSGVLQLDLPASLTVTTRYFKVVSTKGSVAQVVAVGLLRVMNC